MTIRMKTAQYYIDKLEMEPHVEGGYFKECLLGEDTIAVRGDAKRNLWSSIYFLLQKISKYLLSRRSLPF